MSYHQNQHQNERQQHYSQTQYRTHSPYHGEQNYSSSGQYGMQQNTKQQKMHQNNYQQQQNMIKNPQSNTVSNVKSPEMNDRDYLNDILATEKYLTDNHLMFAREASHTELFNDTKQILNETLDCQRDLFNTMFKNGFYSLQSAQGSEIQNTKQQFSNYINSQNPYGG